VTAPIRAAAWKASPVSVYAFDAARGDLLVVWPTSVGSVAHVVAKLSDRRADALCDALTHLSEALWDTYVRPASSADDEDERRRRADERARFDGVVDGLCSPNLPDDSGLMLVSYSPVEESAHRLGRVLHAVADDALTNAVVADVRVELDAVTRAELGDLTGRAVQAATLDRLDVSPIQVAAADEALQRDPLGGGLLAAAIDPAAACVAAAHWLAAAAVVAAGEAGNTPAGLFAEVDDIQAVSVEVPTLVVSRVEDDDVPPRQVVLALLRTAVAVGEGEVADLPRLLAERAELERLVERLPADQRDEILADDTVRATLLDPRRPARDLLEHLLDGIASCFLLYSEYANDGEGFEDGDEQSDESSDVEDDRQDEFADFVRAQAAATRSRLI
jgi:hypothetical protein